MNIETVVICHNEFGTILDIWDDSVHIGWTAISEIKIEKDSAVLFAMGQREIEDKKTLARLCVQKIEYSFGMVGYDFDHEKFQDFCEVASRRA